MRNATDISIMQGDSICAVSEIFLLGQNGSQSAKETWKESADTTLYAGLGPEAALDDLKIVNFF